MVSLPKMIKSTICTLLAISSLGVALSLLGRPCAVEARAAAEGSIQLQTLPTDASIELSAQGLELLQKRAALDAAHASVVASALAEIKSADAVADRKLSENGSDEGDSDGEAQHMCTICHGGAEPSNPDRIVLDTTTAAPAELDEEEAAAASVLSITEPLTCAEYGSTLLTFLFPDDLACSSFQGAAASICGCPTAPPRPCTLCAGGVAPPRPGGGAEAEASTMTSLLPTLPDLTGEAVPTASCPYYAAVAESMYVEGDAGCDHARTVGVDRCGCPPPCKICWDGSDVADRDREVDVSIAFVSRQESTSGDGLDYGGRDADADVDEGGSSRGGGERQIVTCGNVEDAASVVAGTFADQALEDAYYDDATTPNVCAAYQRVFGPGCGCPEHPIVADGGRPGCQMCGGDGDEFELAEPDREVNVVFDGVAIRMTCRSAEALAYDIAVLAWVDGACDDFRVQAAKVGCTCRGAAAAAAAASSNSVAISGTGNKTKVGRNVSITATLLVTFSLMKL